MEICKEGGKSCSLGSIAIAIANFGVKVVQDLIFFSMRSPIKFVAISISLQLNQFSVQL